MKFGLEEALPSPPWFAKTLELTSRLFPVLGRAVFASIAYATTQSGDFNPVARPPEVEQTTEIGEIDEQPMGVVERPAAAEEGESG